MQLFNEPAVVLLRIAAVVPVAESEIRLIAKETPADDATRIDEVDFQVRRTRDLFHVEAGRREAVERIERPPLQQFGQRALERDAEMRMRAEADEAALVARIQQSRSYRTGRATRP